MSYRGITIPLPVGQQGFTGTENPSQAGPGHFLFVDGAELDAGIIRKEGGATKFNASALDGGTAIISGFNWMPTAGNRRDYVFTGGGSILKDTGAGTFGTVMVSGLGAPRDPPPLFVPAGGEGVGSPRSLFCFSMSNQVQVVDADGAVMAAISNPAADWTGANNFPTFGLQHGNRLWAGGNNSDPHRIYYSTLTDHQDFVNAPAGTLSIYPGEGERLVGAVSFRGAMIVFKYPHGIYVVDTGDPTPANWTVTPLTRAVGSLNQHAIIPIEDDILYMSATGGIHALSTTTEFGDYTTSDIGEADKIRNFFRRFVNVSKIRRTVGLWYPRKQQAWFAVPMLGSDDNNLRFISLIEAAQQGQAPNPLSRRFFMSRRDIAISMWLKPDANDIPLPMVGDDVGFIYRLDQETRSKNGAGYPITWETANTDFGFADPALATRSKNGQFLEIAYEPRGAWDLTVEIFWDDILTDIINFSMGSGGASLGSFILDTDVLASSVVRSNRVKMDGSGRRFRMVAENAGLGQDVSISTFHVGMTLGDERFEQQ